MFIFPETDNFFVAAPICRYGSPQVRHAVCSIVLQRIVGMCGGQQGFRVGRKEQQTAYAYAQGKKARAEIEEEVGNVKV